MFPREFKNWKYKMQVGTTINLCDQRPADSLAAKWRWNAAPKLKLVDIIIIIIIYFIIIIIKSYIRYCIIWKHDVIHKTGST